jgi:hypothetical protein
MSDIKQIIEDLNVSICDIETWKLENPESLNLSRAAGQVRAARAELVAFLGKYKQEVSK